VAHETADGLYERGQGSHLKGWRRWIMSIRRWLGAELAEPASVIDAEIDSLALEVFERLQRENTDEAVDDPQGYLFRIADEVARAREEQMAQTQRPATSMRRLLQEGAEPHPDALRRIESVMRRLPPCHREALILHANEGLTCAQIAQRQGLTHYAVLQKLTRSYAKLRMEAGRPE
jgi:RNA polymerase sigma factor (sigma-70 family)